MGGVWGEGGGNRDVYGGRGGGNGWCMGGEEGMGMCVRGGGGMAGMGTCGGGGAEGARKWGCVWGEGGEIRQVKVSQKRFLYVNFWCKGVSLVSKKISVQICSGCPLSSQVVVCGHRLVTFSLTIMKH